MTEISPFSVSAWVSQDGSSWKQLTALGYTPEEATQKWMREAEAGGYDVSSLQKVEQEGEDDAQAE